MRVPRSWTIELLRRWLPYMSLNSVLHLKQVLQRENRIGPSPERHYTLDLRPPISGAVTLREAPADRYTLEEIVCHQVYRQVVDSVRDVQTILDIGANIGITSRYLGAHFPTCKIFAVEADAGNHEILEINTRCLRQNGRFNCVLGAAWSKTGKLAIRRPDGAEGYATFEVGEIEDQVSEAPVLQGYSMNEITALSGFDTLDLVKMDIEGAEIAVFKGNLGWLDRTNALAIEFHGDSRHQTEFDATMAVRGFQVPEGHPHTVLAYRKKPIR